MKLPRDLSGQQLVRTLRTLDYSVTRQKGSHMRLTTNRNGEHHVTIPDHNPLKTGTLAAILNEIARHFDITRDELLDQLEFRVRFTRLRQFGRCQTPGTRLGLGPKHLHAHSCGSRRVRSLPQFPPQPLPFGTPVANLRAPLIIRLRSVALS